jgi:hypothetical protein
MDFPNCYKEKGDNHLGLLVGCLWHWLTGPIEFQLRAMNFGASKGDGLAGRDCNGTREQREIQLDGSGGDWIGPGGNCSS